jgi:signal transduction histidine kinase/ligand-binding sensor domain-containing protein
LVTRLTILWLVIWPGLNWLQAHPYTVYRDRNATDEYRVDRWTTEQGLPQNTVNAIHQTRDGYLWIGTRHGLARYDGVRFADFSSKLVEDDERDLDILGFAEDTDGRLWFYTPRGLVFYYQGQFKPFPLAAEASELKIERISAHPTAGLWVAASEGLFRLNGGSLEKVCGIPRGEGEWFSAMMPDLNSNLWVRVSGAVPLRWTYIEVGSCRVRNLEELLPGIGQIDAIWPDPSGRLWMARPNELLLWDGSNVVAQSAAQVWGGSPVRSLMRDSRGKLWAANYSGTHQLHAYAAGDFRSFGPDDGMHYADDVRAMFGDREGNLWIGTGSGGLYRLQERRLVSIIGGYHSELDEVYSVAPGRDGCVWLATAYGLVKIQGNTHTVYTNSHMQPGVNFSKTRTVLQHSSGEVFLALDFHGLCRLSADELQPVKTPPLSLGSRQVVNSLCEAPDGTLWAAAETGLLELKGDAAKLWSNGEKFSSGQLFRIACGPDGALWAGTRTNGLWRLKDGLWSRLSKRDGLLSQNIWPLVVEPDGTLWAGTPKGLNRVRTNQINSVTTEQGLYYPPHYALLPDGKGNYWSFGNRGIWKVNASELHQVADGRADQVFCVSFGEADGMLSAEGNGDQQPNAAVLPNGQLWFPMTRGVVIVDPPALPENKVKPPIIIEEIRFDDQIVYRDGGFSGPRQMGPNNALLLRPGEARVVEVKFTATTFVDSEKVRFRHRLLGADNDWVTDTHRRALYTNLKPGAYEFEVEACNHHGYWSEAPARFSFILPPRFFETWWFYTVSVLGMGLALGGWHRQRLHNAHKVQRLEQERAVQQERARISKDLHDDLGANLTGIALQLEVARSKAKQPPLVDEYLRACVTGVRELVERMRDVVWSLNPECDSLDSFGNYLSQYAEECAAASNKRCRIDIPQELPAKTLTAETRHHLLMSVKEALNNTAKHSGATEMRISLQCSEKSLILRIGDDGCGFDPDSQARNAERRQAVGHGLGLRNIESRIRSLNGMVNLVSSPEKGTELTVSIPLPK